jgi:hypothetical protein
MALQTLKDVKEIGGFKVIVMDDLRKERPELFNESGQMDYKIFERDIRPHHFIYVRHDVNSISFTLQNGPIKEHGVNGCQVETLIDAARLIIGGFQKDFPCVQNELALGHLENALKYIADRKAERDRRGVEGTSQL